MTTPIEFSNGFISYADEGFFFVRMKDDSYSTVKTLKESHKIMESIQPKGDIYILVDSGFRSNSENEVFSYLQKSDFGKRIKSQAVIVNDLPTRLMGNLFLRYIKHKRNIKIFNDFDSAKLWLVAQMESKSNNKKLFLFI